MKSIINKIFKLLISIDRLRNCFITQVLIQEVFGEKYKTQLLASLRTDLVSNYFTYPSIINNGYLHIERTIGILRHKQLDSKHLILDIGAAGGETCIMFAKALPDCKIIGFEPITKTYIRLRNNTMIYSNIQTHNIALGKEKGLSIINVMNRVTSSSIFSSRGDSKIYGQNYFGITDKEEIEINALDNFNFYEELIAVMKIDVQGYELEVLKGAEQTLKKTNFVLLELQNHDIYIGAPRYYVLDKYLRDSGFELFDLIPSIREDHQIKEFDSLYINKSLDI